jgi:hypothetical protein
MLQYASMETCETFTCDSPVAIRDGLLDLGKYVITAPVVIGHEIADCCHFWEALYREAIVGATTRAGID